MSDPVKIIFGLPSTYERGGWHHPSITQFFADLPFRTGTAYRVVPINNFQPAASGRNVFCKNFKDTDADWLCMIDNDMGVPENLIDTVKDAPADAGIVVPVFYLWDQTELRLVLCWGVDSEPVETTPKHAPHKAFPPGFTELSKCGTGVIFIRPSVLRGLPYPYFRYLYNEDQGMAGTEDIQFCIAAREHGFKIYGNSAVKIGHYHSVELSSIYTWADRIYLDKPNGAAADCKPKDAGSPPAATAALPSVAE